MEIAFAKQMTTKSLQVCVKATIRSASHPYAFSSPGNGPSGNGRASAAAFLFPGKTARYYHRPFHAA
jgi:hypothetical protein